MFPKLYSRTSTGAIHSWQIVVDGDRYHTLSGQVGGIITKSSPTNVEGKNIGKKNETTANEQALKDAQSKFDKKIKSEGYRENINDIDVVSHVEPMLAKSYKDRKGKVKFPALVQLKFNGSRCVATRDGLFTRKGERYMTLVHIEESLAPFFKENPDAVLDGEIYNYELRQQLSELMKLVRRTVNVTSQHLKESRDKVSLFLYDGYKNESDKKSPYSIRKLWVDEVVSKHEFLSFVKTDKVNNETEMWTKYNEYVVDGEEGAILRFEDSPYENKRSSNLLKLKPLEDDEWEIVDISEGSGNWQGLAKIITCKLDTGREFNATFKGNMIDAKFALDNKDKYIGKKYTFSYNGWTNKAEVGSPKGCPCFCQWDFKNSTEINDK